MSSFWRTILGIRHSSGEVALEGNSRLELTALPHGAYLLLVVAALLGLGYLYWRLNRVERNELTRPQRAFLVFLRLLVLIAISAMLIEPVLITTRIETVDSHLPIIFDDSESMKFSDPYTDETKAAQLASALQLKSDGAKSPIDRLRETPRLDLVKEILAPNLEKLGKGREIFLYNLESAAKTAGSSRTRKLEDIQPGRGVSPLGDSLRDVLALHRGRPVAGIVMITDGRSNAGEDPMRAAEVATRQGIPVYLIASGADEGPRNVRLAEIEASPVVFARDPMTIGIVVESRGLKDAEGTITLEQRVNDGPWEPLGDQRIALGEDGVLKRTTFRIVPKVVGQYEFRAHVGGAGPELTQEDNTSTTSVKVVRQQIRLLLIAGSPSPEVQFLNNALMRDQHIESAIWLQHADPGFKQGGDRPIIRLPSDSEELAKYDALILMDADMQSLGPAWPEMIMNFVGKDGGGLIYVPGELYSQQIFEGDETDSATGKWTKLLPVVREPGLFRTESQVRLSTQNTYVLELTAEGRGDPIFEFNPDPIRNRSVLASLPGMYWSFPVTRARPGATVLARHGDPRMQNQHGRQVLLASQLYGPGRTVFLGFDATYRWRFLGEDYFDGFWARLVDRVGRNKALGGRFPFQVYLGKSTYRVGEQVSVGVRYTEAAAVAEAAELVAELETAGQPPEPVTFVRAADDAELLTATFPADKAGTYSLKITPATGAEPGSGVRVSTTNFRVEPPRREVDEPSLNRPLLTSLAQATKGQVFDLPGIAKLDETIAMREVTRTLEDREELWDAPIFYALIIVGLTAEWISRKLFRMI